MFYVLTAGCGVAVTLLLGAIGLARTPTENARRRTGVLAVTGFFVLFSLLVLPCAVSLLWWLCAAP